MRRCTACLCTLAGLCVMLAGCSRGLPTQAQIDELLANRQPGGYLYISHQPMDTLAILGEDLYVLYVGDEDWSELEIEYSDGIVYRTSLEIHQDYSSMRFNLHQFLEEGFAYFTISRYSYSGPVGDPDRYMLGDSKQLYSYIILDGQLNPFGIVDDWTLARHTEFYHALLSEAQHIANGGEARVRPRD